MQQVRSPGGIITYFVLHGGVIMCPISHGVWYGFFKMAAENFAWNRVCKYFSGIHVFKSDQYSLLIYLCLLLSSATVKMDNGENMENVRYATNDDTAGFINQTKSRKLLMIWN